MSAAVLDNVRWETTRPTVSVLIPFLRDDPADLLTRLNAEAPALDGAVEIVLLDDGTGDPVLTTRLAAQVRALTLPARLISLSANEGRAVGRNRLASAARGKSLLFLDSDMRPDQPGFLQCWSDLAATENPAVAFGGFSLLQAPDEARFAVHRAMAAKSECVAAPDRAKQPEKYVYTSNLLVRRDVFEAEAFDESFAGWGWEDVEWGLRVARRWPVRHIDNTATHLGLDAAPALLGKWEQSAANFARVVAAHGEVVRHYPSYRAARALRRAPFRPAWRPALKALALAAWVPLDLRAVAARLYRAALYAEVV